MSRVALALLLCVFAEPALARPRRPAQIPTDPVCPEAGELCFKYTLAIGTGAMVSPSGADAGGAISLGVTAKLLPSFELGLRAHGVQGAFAGESVGSGEAILRLPIGSPARNGTLYGEAHGGVATSLSEGVTGPVFGAGLTYERGTSARSSTFVSGSIRFAVAEIRQSRTLALVPSIVVGLTL